MRMYLHVRFDYAPSLHHRHGRGSPKNLQMRNPLDWLVQRVPERCL